MRSAVNLAKFLLFVVPLAALLVMSTNYVVHQWQHALDYVDEIVEDQASVSLGRKITVGRVKVFPFGTAQVDNVVIPDTPYPNTTARPPIAEIKNIKVSYNVHAILTGKGAAAVKTVVITKPVVNLLRRSDGRLNVQDLVRPPKRPPGPAFRGTVEIKNGTVNYDDAKGFAKVNTFKATLRTFNAYLDARHQPAYRVLVSASGEKDRLKNLRISGRYDSITKSIISNVQAQQVSLPYTTAIFGLTKNTRILKGTMGINAGVQLSMSTGKLGMRALNALVNFADVSASIPRFGNAISGVNGSAVVIDEQAVVNLKGILFDSNTDIKGVISGIRNPSVDIAMNIPDVDCSSASRLFSLTRSFRKLKVEGRGNIIARIKGDISDPMIEAKVKAPEVKYEGYKATDVALHGRYSEGVVDVKGITLHAFGADVGAVGSMFGFKHGSPEFSMKAWLRHMDMSFLPVPKDTTLRGVAGMDVTASGRLISPRAEVVLRVDKPFGKSGDNTVDAEKIYARLGYADKTFLIRDMVVAGAMGGSITANGSISPKNIDVKLSARQTDFSKVASLFGLRDAGGYGFFDGQISGTPRNPSVDGMIEAFSANYHGYDANYIKGKVSGDREKLTITDGVLLRSPTDISFTAELRDLTLPQIPFSLETIVHRLDIQNTLALFKRDADISGIVSGDLRAMGVLLTKPEKGKLPFKNAKGTLLANVTDGVAYGYPVKATFDFTYNDDLIDILKAVVRSDKTELIANGTIAPETHDLNVDFDLQEADLAELRSRYGRGIHFTGVGKASGSIKGQWDDPTVDACGSIDSLLVNGMMFDSTQYEASYGSGVIRNAKLDLKRSDQSVHLQVAKVDIPGKYIEDASGTIKQLNITDLWDAVLSSPAQTGTRIRNTASKLPRITSGVLDGEFQVSGNFNKPEGNASLSIKNAGLDREKIESIDMSSSMKDGVYNLDRFLAKIGNGTIEAVGAPAYSDGQTKTDISVRNLDIQSLTPFLGSNTPKGVMEAELQAEGPFLAPFIRGSLEVVKPGFGNVILDGLRAGDVRISLDKSELPENVRKALGDKQAIVLADDAVVAVSDHQLNVSGYIPWDWSTFNVPNDLPMSLSARINNQQLGTLAKLLPALDPEYTNGTLEGAVELSGTRAKHQFGGGIRLKDGQVAIKNLKNRFNNINMDVGFIEGDKLSVNQFTIGSDLGGNLSIKPGGYVQIGPEKTGNIDMQVIADGFKTGEKNLFGMTEDVQVKLDAGIGINGPLMNPAIADKDAGKIKGGIKVSDSKIVFAIPETKKKVVAPPSVFNPSFDISMNLGDNVLVQPPAMKIITNGGGTLKGTFNQPNLNLRLGVTQGNMAFAARRLRITPGGSVLVRYAPPESMKEKENYTPDVNVDFHATTSIQSTGSFGKKERYQVALNATGNLSKLNVDLTSQPEGLSKEQILAELGHVGSLGTGGVQLEKEMSNIISAVGTSTLFSPIETLFVEQLGFEQFTLDYNRTSQSSVYFSRSLSSNLYLSYFQTLTAGLSATDNNKYELKLGYRPKGPYQLTFGVDEQQIYTLDLSISKLF